MTGRDPRFQHLCTRLHQLGPRPLAEMLAEVAARIDEPGIIADRLEAYASLDPAVVRTLGGDRFPPLLVEVTT